MGKIRITLDVYDEFQDLSDSTGLNVHGYEHVHRVLSEIGDDLDVERVD